VLIRAFPDLSDVGVTLGFNKGLETPVNEEQDVLAEMVILKMMNSEYNECY